MTTGIERGGCFGRPRWLHQTRVGHLSVHGEWFGGISVSAVLGSGVVAGGGRTGWPLRGRVQAHPDPARTAHQTAFHPAQQRPRPAANDFAVLNAALTEPLHSAFQHSQGPHPSQGRQPVPGRPDRIHLPRLRGGRLGQPPPRHRPPHRDQGSPLRQLKLVRVHPPGRPRFPLGLPLDARLDGEPVAAVHDQGGGQGWGEGVVEQLEEGALDELDQEGRVVE